MKPVKCPNNHYYDAEKYESCPHCNGKEVQDTATKADNEEKKRFSFFSKKSRTERTSSIMPNEFLTQEVVFSSSPDFVNSIENRKEISVSNSAFAEMEDDNDKNRFKDVSLEKIKKDFTENKEIDIRSDSSNEYSKNLSDNEYFAAPAEKSGNSPLNESIKTTNSASVYQDSKTVGFFSTADDSEPVVGWLVCVKGQYFGESFNLKAGRNNIGRSLNMDIVLAKEGSISRIRHAVITFDPKNSKFILQAGEGNGLTYHNNELVITYVDLNDYDVIQLGQAEFIFSSFCNKSFSWDEYLK